VARRGENTREGKRGGGKGTVNEKKKEVQIHEDEKKKPECPPVKGGGELAALIKGNISTWFGKSTQKSLAKGGGSSMETRLRSLRHAAQEKKWQQKGVFGLEGGMRRKKKWKRAPHRDGKMVL